MRTRIAVSTLLVLALAVAGSMVARAGQGGAAPATVDAAFAAYWAADDLGEAAARADALLEAGVDFDTAWTRLAAGRTYGAQPTGAIDMPWRRDGVVIENVIEVPEDYDPSRAWPLRVQLHGGVGRPLDARRLDVADNRIRGEAQIYVHPKAWNQGMWWQPIQVDNVLRLVDQVKRRYNVDESRIYVTGISDGGTGAYFFAMRVATPWASCNPLNGHPMVLANPDTGVDGQLYLTNLRNCPMRIVNGGRDRLYPAANVAPFVDLMERAGVGLTWQVYPEAGHDTSWWAGAERAPYEAHVAAHPRDAHPATISWETERTDRYDRFRWLVIDELGARPSDRTLEDFNTFRPNPQARLYDMYDRRRASGRVDVTRTGNAFDASTRGVETFTLLLSPDVVDFDAPVTVAVNGETVFDGPVVRDVDTLVTWAARDNDRTMLYGAALTIRVP
jgi:poly(3-hydroxybutyrate) depolymerase